MKRYLFPLLLLAPMLGLAQIQIIGKITDSNENALEGVSIQIQNTETVILSNSKGQFYFDLEENAYTLELCFPSYLPLEIAVDSSSYIKIMLEKDPYWESERDNPNCPMPAANFLAIGYNGGEETPLGIEIHNVSNRLMEEWVHLAARVRYRRGDPIRYFDLNLYRTAPIDLEALQLKPGLGYNSISFGEAEEGNYGIKRLYLDLYNHFADANLDVGIGYVNQDYLFDADPGIAFGLRKGLVENVYLAGKLEYIFNNSEYGSNQVQYQVALEGSILADKLFLKVNYQKVDFYKEASLSILYKLKYD